MFFGKGQVSSEFFISFSLMLIVISTFMGVVIFLGDFNKSELQLSAEVLGDFILNEVELATESPPLFESSFSLPDRLDDFEYTICIADSASSDNDVLLISSCGDGGVVSASSLGVDVSGDISSGGDVVIRKSSSGIDFLCFASGGGPCTFISECNIDFLSNLCS